MPDSVLFLGSQVAHKKCKYGATHQVDSVLHQGVLSLRQQHVYEKASEMDAQDVQT